MREIGEGVEEVEEPGEYEKGILWMRRAMGILQYGIACTCVESQERRLSKIKYFNFRDFFTCQLARCSDLLADVSPKSKFVL